MAPGRLAPLLGAPPHLYPILHLLPFSACFLPHNFPPTLRVSLRLQGYRACAACATIANTRTALHAKAQHAALITSFTWIKSTTGPPRESASGTRGFCLSWLR